MENQFAAEQLLDLMRERHSVRQYQDRPVEQEKRAILEALAERLNREYDLSMKIFWDEPKCFSSFMAKYGKFEGVKNYIVLSGKKGGDLDVRLGYCGEALALEAQKLGLNTCWVALTHGKTAEKPLAGEKQLCLISLGYGRGAGVAHTNKPLGEVCNLEKDAPEWFTLGMQAALLAPTAMNQQKFFFTLKDGKVKLTTKGGFYTKLDMGIVKYHFEAVSGRKVEI